MKLNSQQRSFLKSAARSLQPVVLLGRAGLSDFAIREIDRALTDHELIKIKLNPGGARKEQALAAAEATGAEIIGVTGRTAVLFRARTDGSTSFILPGQT